MLGLFRRSKKEEPSEKVSSVSTPSTDTSVPQVGSDERLIAVISAAIARFRENEGSLTDAGFIVRRIRRV